MIMEFVQRFDAARETIHADIQSRLDSGWEPSYRDLVAILIHYIKKDDNVYGNPSAANITVIGDDYYQGTMVFVIPEGGYQPSRFWVTKVDYGSCSGCDTLQAALNSNNDNAIIANDLLTLMLHLLQQMKAI